MQRLTEETLSRNEIWLPTRVLTFADSKSMLVMYRPPLVEANKQIDASCLTIVIWKTYMTLNAFLGDRVPLNEPICHYEFRMCSAGKYELVKKVTVWLGEYSHLQFYLKTGVHPGQGGEFTMQRGSGTKWLIALFWHNSLHLSFNLIWVNTFNTAQDNISVLNQFLNLFALIFASFHIDTSQKPYISIPLDGYQKRINQLPV